jgi:CheY-like chemotaxis protein
MAKILIVEDDCFLRGALRSLLETRNHTVVEAADGEVARQLVGALPVFDLVMSDIQMPFITGFQLLSFVKEHKPTKFILMTGYSKVMETPNAAFATADAFMTKPFRGDDLLKMIDQYVGPSPENLLSPADYFETPIGPVMEQTFLSRDVFMLIGDRFVKIGRKGEVPPDWIRNTQVNGLKSLFVLKKSA